MKKFLFISAATLCISFPTFAGDYLTNTNQNAAFLRMIARGASIDIDGVYSNPAGLSFLSHEGFYLSLTGQSAYQTRLTLISHSLNNLTEPTAADCIKELPLLPSSRAFKDYIKRIIG